MGVTGAAYTNNDLNTATEASLFDIDNMNDRVCLQSPCGEPGPHGNLVANAGTDAGFDIYFDAKRGTNEGFAALNTGAGSRPHRVDVLTGAPEIWGPSRSGNGSPTWRCSVTGTDPPQRAVRCAAPINGKPPPVQTVPFRRSPSDHNDGPRPPPSTAAGARAGDLVSTNSRLARPSQSIRRTHDSPAWPPAGRAWHATDISPQ
ncbi:DUF4394 domain-containing protein [Streptomyces goshikiensis]